MVKKTKTNGALTKVKTSQTVAKVWAAPTCSKGLKLRVKLVAKLDGSGKTRWQRTWKPRTRPGVHCSLSGNG